MRAPSLFGCIVLASALIGCATAAGPFGGTSASDSLRAENAQLRDQNHELRDSLRLYDDIESGQYNRNRRALQDQINRLTYDVQLLRDGGLTVAVLPADSLFASISGSLSSTGKARLQSIAAQLQQTYPNRTVWVEGHTDTAPLSERLQERFPSNWELSTARAAAVVRRLIEMTSLDRSQFVAVGYGSTRPVASNRSADGRRRNRRVRVAVLPLPGSYSRPFETAW